MSQIIVNSIPGGEPARDSELPARPFNYPAGSLVRVRRRDWIVLPGSSETLLKIRPIDGSPDEETAVVLGLDSVEPSRFSPPNPQQRGDFLSGSFLRDAYRFSLRASAGPFRSFGRVNFTPRSYQFVPLIMALRQKTVRLLIADDVGVGKTIEAGLIIRELFDRGEIERFSIVCPPHLAPQWEKELFDKFRLEAKVVLPSTAARLERSLPTGRPIFEEYPFTIVSIDYIKNERHRRAFLRSAPELIVIDEAHTVSVTDTTVQQQRNQLAAELCEEPSRHILLLTATPHSGKGDAFRSLLSLLRPDFKDIPKDLSGPQNENQRKQIANYYIQRRRQDIKNFDDHQQTRFPRTESKDLSWKLTPQYRELFQLALKYAQELIGNRSGERCHQRMRWWSALALLRALASSPAAAAATLRRRAESLEPADDDLERFGRNLVCDLGSDDELTTSDLSDCCQSESFARNDDLERMAKAANELRGDNDPKLKLVVKEIKSLLKDGFSPIVFCRYIATAEYLYSELPKKIRKVNFECVTGMLPPEARDQKIEDLCQSADRVLICTDCLSEGINLQESFDAVIHYDLSWNPTRHEQREGRVDRFGQASPKVRRLTIYGEDNGIDGLILDKIIKKSREIKQDTGVMVQLPANPDGVAQAIFKGLNLRSASAADRNRLFPELEDIFEDWFVEAETQKRNRKSIFEHDVIHKQLNESLRPELEAVNQSVGTPDQLRDFVLRVLRYAHAHITELRHSDEEGITYEVDFSGVDEELRFTLPDRFTDSRPVRLRFEPPCAGDTELICRTHPLVDAIAEYVINGALGNIPNTPARRCGAFRTDLVTEITTILLLRCRYHICRPAAPAGGRDAPAGGIPTAASRAAVRGDAAQTGNQTNDQVTNGNDSPRWSTYAQETPATATARRGVPEILAEDIRFLAFPANDPEWLPNERLQELLASTPANNISDGDAEKWLKIVLDSYDDLQGHINTLADQWAEELRDSHQRVRDIEKKNSKSTFSYHVRPEPPDWLGVYILMPELPGRPGGR